MTSDRTLVRRILEEGRPHRARLAGLFLIGLLETPALLLVPIPVKIAVDSVIGSHPLPPALDAVVPDALTRTDTGVLALAAVLQIVVVILLHVQQIAVRLLAKSVGEGLTLRFRAKLFAHLQRLSFSFHDSRGTADSMYRIQYDAPSVQAYIVESVLPVAAAVVSLVSLFAVTAGIHWPLALVALTVSPFLFLLSRMYKVRLRARHRHAKQIESSALKIVQETLTGLRVVKAFGREAEEHERFVGRAKEGMRARVRLVLAEGVLDMLVSVTTAAGTAIVLFIGVRSVQTRTISLGQLLMILAYLSQLYAPLKVIARKVVSAQSALAGAERAFDVLDRFPDVVEARNPQPIGRARGALEVSDLSFTYDAGNPVLRNASVRIPAGTRLGVAGPTGAGKTTLASLMMRFYDPQQGTIRLDGVDLRKYRVSDLRRQFSLVLQDPLLFSASIRENIAYGFPDANDALIIEAAKMAAAHGFITRLPDGYDTIVGERGMSLSGGERQRISLARAFLRDAPILILDEPTSALDAGTEAEIVDVFDRLMAGRTTVLISHRPTTLTRCDAWVEVRGGTLTPLTHPDSVSHRRSSNRKRAWTLAAEGVFDREQAVDLEHEAVAAWRLVNPEGRVPAFVETLVRPGDKKPKSKVFRLGEVGHGGGHVVAKREAPDVVRLERFIYEEVLPACGLPSLYPYGVLLENGPSWIFLENAGGTRYSETDPVHRAVAAEWTAALHVATSERPGLAERLPDHGPGRYLDHLRRARRTIAENLGNPVLTRGDVEVLDAIVTHCDELESTWREFDEFCDAAPACLVHGDLAPKNARVRMHHGKPSLCLLDWETAGWGSPAADIARLDPLAYRRSITGAWPHLDQSDVLELARIGTIFRALAAVDWDSRMLRYPWIEQAMINIRCYEGWLALARERSPSPVGESRR